jgi:hypothetical protein
MKARCVLAVIAFNLTIGFVLDHSLFAEEPKDAASHDARIKWFREARFGMFIHWGIYSQLGRGEWVQFNEKIPVKEYKKLAATFNPFKFDAEKWVKTAKDAGCKYIVITAKHHDGFSMFRARRRRNSISSFAWNWANKLPFFASVPVGILFCPIQKRLTIASELETQVRNAYHADK